MSQPQGHSAAGRIMSIKNSSDTIGNRTRDLSACSAVPQPTAPPRAPNMKGRPINCGLLKIIRFIRNYLMTLKNLCMSVADHFNVDISNYGEETEKKHENFS